jgi:putative hydroxymethylpyrimidine transport system ATP-binding protein
MNPGPPAVEVREVSHRFARARGHPGVDVLDSVSLQVPPGGFVSIVGPSGSGKSTLLRMLAGLLVPDRGSVLIGGVPVTGPGGVAFQPQRDLLLPWRRVLANATLGAEVAGVAPEQARAQAHALLTRFGLAGFERSWPAQLSGGMRQRVALLRTYLAPRDVVLLDEPLGALDAITRRDLHGWLQDLHAEGERTTVLVTHDVEEALVLGDTVLVLSARPGRVVGEVACDWPRPRPPDIVVEPAFVAAKATLLDALARHR